MIEFRQKSFSEYDAMRSLYVELMKDYNFRNRVRIIDSSALLPILKGNNVVIERFVITTSFARKDRYRMYLKVGAKAKMPDDIRLPEHEWNKRLGNFRLSFKRGLKFKGPGQKEYTDKKKNNNNNNNNNNDPKFIDASFEPIFDLSIPVRNLLGDALKYDKKERSIVLEFGSISDAIKALDILPFGINYNLYLLS